MSIDAFFAGICTAGTGVGLLHRQERADTLDLTLETAVGEGLAFGSQPAPCHPLSILLLLQGEFQRHNIEKRAWETGVTVVRAEMMN